jgi:uncharacterized protein YbjT (DUF2867 family)
MSTYAITGATGNTGKIIAERLLEEGNKVRVIGRSAERLSPLVEKGAEARIGTIDDEKFLTEAFTGADAVYAMIPPDMTVDSVRAQQNRIGEALATAIENAGVEHVVFLSSLGAHVADKTGPIAGLHDVEKRLNELTGVHVLHLRPSYFMENFLAGVGTIRNMGVYGSPTRGDISLPIIATQDIGEYAAKRLSKLDFTGHSTRELHGERDLTMAEATSVLGKAIGIDDLAYVQFPYEDAENALMAMGFSPDGARSYSEMGKALNEGIITAQETRSTDNTTPTSIEEFSTLFAAVYNAG